MEKLTEKEIKELLIERVHNFHKGSGDEELIEILKIDMEKIIKDTINNKSIRELIKLL